MLDMAFQLLAFFILTFKAPSAETHLDLDLPATPAALPAAAEGRAQPRQSRRVDTDLENDLLVRAEADDLGDLKALRLGEAAVPDLPTLGNRLRRYTQLLEGRPLRVRLVADDRLRYEPAAQIIATCSAAGVASIRLSPPGSTPVRSGAAEPDDSPRGPAPGPAAPRATRRARHERPTPLRHPAAGAVPGVLGGRRGPGYGRGSGSAHRTTGWAWPTWPPIARRSRARRPPTMPGRPIPRSSVGFRDLWKRPDAYRGRRVTVRGRLERTFRQGAVGSFPPLVEAWIFSTSGDPFCVVYPQAGAGSSTGTGPSGVSAPGSSTDAHRGEARPASPAGPGPGRVVRFTGTFLKMVRYAAGDGDRLAPLIVGDRPPASPSPETAGESKARSGRGW